MNKHMWKKLGEVKAFSEAGIDFIERGQVGLREVFAEDEIAELTATHQVHRDKIAEIATTANKNDIVDKKAEATKEKLVDLQDRYLTDEDDWQDPMELLEWSGFFHGGALVHWNLIAGASQVNDISSLTSLAQEGYEFHHDLLHITKDALSALAAEE